MTVAIIGAGIMGINLGYFLAQRGIQVEIFEGSSDMGGLAGPMRLEDGVEVDRFYHAILSSDAHLSQLCQELGLTDQLRFKETGTGFYKNGNISSMDGLADFLRFPPLNLFERFRLGLTVALAQLVKDWHTLEGITVERWLRRLGGNGVFDKIWGPMMWAKFDGQFDRIPATWMWSRLVRTKSTREGTSQKEGAGHIIGGYITLLRAMAERIEVAGGRIHLNRPVQEIVIEDGTARGIRIDGELKYYEAVAVTAQTPVFRRMIPNAPQSYHDFLGKTDYLGIVCPLLVLDRSLTGVWTLNIADKTVPFTGIIETTTFIDPKYVGGHHLVYIPKYTAPNSTWLTMSDEEVKTVWLENLEKMFPKFDRKWIRYFIVNRTRYVEPLHELNSTNLIPGIETPVKNLFLATTAQIYPALTNGESVSRHAHHAADLIVKAIPTPTPSPAAVLERTPAVNHVLT